MKKLYSSFLFLSIVLALTLSASAQNKVPEQERGIGTAASFKLLYPSAGEVLTIGQSITIQWEDTVPESIAKDIWGEKEIVLLDGVSGQSYRISPEMSLRTKSFSWVVPAVPTDKAQIVMKMGTASGDTVYIVSSNVFTIAKSEEAKDSHVELKALAEAPKAGGKIQLSWSSDIQTYTTYDVMVSYDRGAHFHKAGSTSKFTYVINVPQDFSGSYTFQIVARVKDGRVFKSVISEPVKVDE